MKQTADISRGDSSTTYNSVISNIVYFLLVLSALSLVFPAMSCGCTPSASIITDDETYPHSRILQLKSPITADDGNDHVLTSLDVFAFRTDGLKHLDSYQRFDSLSGNEVRIASGSGQKRIFVCANSQWQRNDWAIVNSIEALAGFKADMENERMKSPLMTGEVSTCDGKVTSVYLSMLASEIHINSLRCDFSDKGYKGCNISDVRIYLINVNASCGITSEGVTMPERIINSGRLDPYDMGKLCEPDLICVSLGEDISSEAMYPEIRLRCYPNASAEESPGSPFTKLVIEGAIMGETYYWPIAVGRQGNTNGIFRNCIYCYDITITGKGSPDPDVCADMEAIDINIETKPWKEKDSYSISY